MRKAIAIVELGEVARFEPAGVPRVKRHQDTLVVFLSDNGAPFPREKGTVYDGSVRTPLIFRWPGVVPQGVRHGGLMSVIDLAPTFLSLAGVDV